MIPNKTKLKCTTILIDRVTGKQKEALAELIKVPVDLGNSAIVYISDSKIVCDFYLTNKNNLDYDEEFSFEQVMNLFKTREKRFLDNFKQLQ